MVKVKYRFSSLLLDSRKKQLAKERAERRKVWKQWGFYASSFTGPRFPSLKGSPFFSRWLKRDDK